MRGPKQEKVRKPWVLHLYSGFSACRCQKKSVVHIFFGNGVVIRHALHKSASGRSYRQIWLKCNEKTGCVGFAQALTDACWTKLLYSLNLPVHVEWHCFIHWIYLCMLNWTALFLEFTCAFCRGTSSRGRPDSRWPADHSAAPWWEGDRGAPYQPAWGRGFRSACDPGHCAGHHAALAGRLHCHVLVETAAAETTQWVVHHHFVGLLVHRLASARVCVCLPSVIGVPVRVCVQRERALKILEFWKQLLKAFRVLWKSVKARQCPWVLKAAYWGLRGPWKSVNIRQSPWVLKAAFKGLQGPWKSVKTRQSPWVLKAAY